ncbi:MAG TPA: hypothetical protein VKT28_07730 [Puia sp.]|nr:hypothetical protein [Puia sp.]
MLLICLVLSVYNLKAQSNSTSSIKNQFTDYAQAAIQEKIFAHTDKGFYLAGEILWFKLYDVDATFHQPLNLSKLAYVEIIGDSNKPVLQAKIFLKNGIGGGSFYLPLNINSGSYKLRAYTNWMKNYSAEFFFEKEIAIVNPKKQIIRKTENAKALPDVQFFPEGGNLVNNIASKVAFKIIGANGKGIDCSGAIVNENNDTVARFSTAKFGMGNFDFTPSAGHVYHAVITLPSGKNINAKFPEIYNQGYVLNVADHHDGKLVVNVETNISSENELYLFVHTRQSVKIAMSSVFQNGHASFLIDEEKLGDGISHFTVFNSNKQPVCERLYFKYPNRKLQLDILPEQKEFATRKKINVQINAANENKKEESTDMSMSVYRLDDLQAEDENTIESYLWLTSDIKGAIESPGYYFREADNETIEAMDNLMLTQGWRRFNWNEVLAGQKPSFEFAPEYNGHIITGKVINLQTKTAATNVLAYLSVPSVRAQFSTSLSDSNGAVKFEMTKMFGSSEIIVQANSLLDNSCRVDISNPFSEKYSNKIFSPLNVSESQMNVLNERNIGMQVQNIYASNQLRHFDFYSTDTMAFFQKPTASYLLDNYTRFTTVEEVLREYVALISVRLRKDKFQISVLDDRRRGFFVNDPLVLLDAVPIFDVDKIMAYDPLKIRKLDVLNSRYFIGNAIFDGILSFTTYEGNLNGFDLDPHATVIDYEGLQLKREFYSPVYDTEEKRAGNMPDFRNLLFWSPDIKTDSKGKSQISFYSSDIPGKYAIVLQGITNDGRFGSKVASFEVKE